MYDTYVMIHMYDTKEPAWHRNLPSLRQGLHMRALLWNHNMEAQRLKNSNVLMPDFTLLNVLKFLFPDGVS